MTTMTRRIIMCCVRFQNLCEAAEVRWAETAEMDALVDYGEWSGAASGRLCLEEQREIARRLGFASVASARDCAKLVGAVLRDGGQS